MNTTIATRIDVVPSALADSSEGSLSDWSVVMGREGLQNSPQVLRLEHSQQVLELDDHLLYQQFELSLILLGIFASKALPSTANGEALVI